MSRTLTTEERHRPPTSLRAAVRRLFALASSGSQPASAGGIFDRAQNTSIQNANFTINQYGGIVPEYDPRPGGDTGGASGSFRPQQYDPLPSPRRESPDVYVDCLLTKNRGYPLWIPSPSTSLPDLNRQLGVSLGDVGVFTREGGFKYLFNVFQDASHPINAVVGVPEGFVPFILDVPPGLEFVEWNGGSYLSDPSIRRVDNGHVPLKTILEATGSEAAVLMIPEETRTNHLQITTLLREYIQKNIVAWYRFVKNTLGHDIENGDLRVVSGTRKSSGFGIATAFNTESRRFNNTKLTFWVDSTRDRTFTVDWPYHWSHTGSAETKVGASERENFNIADVTRPVRNQCLFVSTIDAKLSDKIWKQIEGLGIEVAMNQDSYPSFNVPRPDSSSQPTARDMYAASVKNIPHVLQLLHAHNASSSRADLRNTTASYMSSTVMAASSNPSTGTMSPFKPPYGPTNNSGLEAQRPEELARVGSSALVGNDAPPLYMAPSMTSLAGSTGKSDMLRAKERVSYQQSYERVFHPSAILHDLLETIAPDLSVYLVCDNDWAPFVTYKNINVRDFVKEVLLRRNIVESHGMAYFDVSSRFLKSPRQSAEILFRNTGLDTWYATRMMRASISNPKPSYYDSKPPEENLSSSKEPAGPTGGMYHVKTGAAVDSSELPV